MTEQETRAMNAEASKIAIALIDAVTVVNQTSTLPESRKLLLILTALRFVHLQMCRAAELPPELVAIAETLAIDWAGRCPLPPAQPQTHPVPNTGKADA